MNTPTATEIAVKHAIEAERLKLLAILKETKTLEEAVRYLENLLKA
ncbi:MAG: hypothetical protein LBS74_07960 [Oscillospiraceae bacterium]|jgi:hypothetical protein|nr:hypothetical protein [Oscillospiraceae bacterium]